MVSFLMCRPFTSTKRKLVLPGLYTQARTKKRQTGEMIVFPAFKKHLYLYIFLQSSVVLTILHAFIHALINSTSGPRTLEDDVQQLEV